MRDYWFAECIPCRWETKHDDQDSAIRAAEDHVSDFHRGVPPEVRGREFMGHVQNRTETSPSDSTFQPAVPPYLNALHDVSGVSGNTEWPIELAPTAGDTPGGGESGNT